MSVENTLLAPQEALWSYLDALLREIPKPSAAVAEEIQDWDPSALEPAGPSIAKLPVAALAPAAAVVSVPETQPEPAAVQPRERPAWAEAEFQALLFSVGGLSLAVPLVALQSVSPWPEQGVTPMPNQPHWCHGLLRYRGHNVRVVDTAAMVIPADRAELMPTEPPEHLLIVGDGRWALACSAIGDVIRLAPEQVRWRSHRGSRPWLAGTVLERLCALIDTEAFAAMLAKSC